MVSSALRTRPLAALALGLGFFLAPLAAPAQERAEIAALAQALAAAQAGDWAGASAAAQGASAEAADVIEWQRLRAGEGRLAEYEAFLARRPDWPGLPLLKEKGEPQLLGADAARVLAYFGADLPRSADGALALIGALEATGQAQAAEAEALRAWTSLKFTEAQEAALLARHPGAAQAGDLARLDAILWEGEREAEAGRMLARVGAGWQALARARLALRANAEDAATFVKAVPAELAGDPGLAFERFLWRMRRDLYPDALQMILATSTSAQALGRPEAWTERRLMLARYLLRKGQHQEAYRVASRHFLPPEADGYNDLEFLAGFVALRKLGDASTALAHFQNLPQQGTPITTTRRAYWLGRAFEALGRAEEARAAYALGAQGQSAYYGLLSAEKLGMRFDASLLGYAWPDGRIKGTRLAQSSVLAAATDLAKAGDLQLSGRFVAHLSATLTPEEMQRLAGLSLETGQFRNALLVAKAAAERGVIIPGAYYPIPDVVPYELPVSRALALSIARRESEFNAQARSAAGALGLMQVMPETARAQAKLLGVPFDEDRLTSDPAYNLLLGSEYLKGLLDQFGPSIPLIAVGYNAGPRRSSDWLEAIGDLRNGAVDPVDWVETIPFSETRTYVMRVVESVVIYRAKLKGKAGKVEITSELTGN